MRARSSGPGSALPLPRSRCFDELTMPVRIPRSVARRVVYPLKDSLVRRRTLAVLEELRTSQALPRPALRALQAERLRRILDHAYRYVPYYRSLFQEQGLGPDDIRSPSELREIPVLTKEIV